MSSLKVILYNKIRGAYPIPIHGGVIEKMSIDYGYKASNGSRRCRELVNMGLIEPIYEKGFVLYKWIPPKEKTFEELEAERQGLLIRAIQ